VMNSNTEGQGKIQSCILHPQKTRKDAEGRGRTRKDAEKCATRIAPREYAVLFASLKRTNKISLLRFPRFPRFY
jgi:hypothetical protein